MPDAPIKISALCWNQYTDWASLRAAGIRADELGYDALWTWDHLYPIVGSDDGPIFEGYTTLAAWAEATSRVQLGLMVGANTFRNPALVAKMITTLDHVSGGRAWLGIGAAWFETEHTAFGIPFGHSPGERLDWLDEAVGIMHGMLRGTRPSGSQYYAANEVRNDPPPVQAHLPIVIGGGGERKTLRTVARYADACNIGGSAENVRHKDEVLRRHCDEIGRDEAEIERTTGAGVIIIRDDPAEAQRVFEETFARNGKARLWSNQRVGTVDSVVEQLRPYAEAGFRHFDVGFPAPYDAETMERMITEVKPRLEAL
ncbi:MAG TPA: TIGR03560 family F420-dependent LLM class oxidoreductase [Candidatus Limnocylindria bacterium]|jgi:F420-dependent oxidoreductase-like protein|nr:TIGR03560 family F420-dependent LLM class oxidoreductase [Candidatus Limnocylindria bacterium]